MTRREKKERFQVRDSPLTIALRDPNHRATLSFFFAGQIVILIGRCLNYVFDHDLMRKDVELFARYFTNVHIMFVMEGICLSAFIFILLPSTILWTRRKINRLFHLLIVLSAAIIVVGVPAFLAITYRMHPILRGATVFQQTRYIMKLISFVVENNSRQEIEKVATSLDANDMNNNNNNNNNNSEKTEMVQQISRSERKYPSLNSLLYFMYAPTLIYQHEYPRSKGPIRWSFVLSNFLIGIAPAPLGLIVCRKLLESCEMIGLRAMTPSDVITMWYWSVAAAVMGVVCMGFFFFHFYSNCWAEVLRFGDRQFYKNWWSASNPLVWMSLWNSVVQSWIAEYFYKPTLRLVRSRFLAIVITFLVSGICHDYVFTFIWGFFVPGCLSLALGIVLTAPIVFVIVQVVPLLPLPSTNVNTFVCYMIFMSFAYFLPLIEYMSRVNCPDTAYDEVTDFFVFRSLTCVKLKWQ